MRTPETPMLRKRLSLLAVLLFLAPSARAQVVEYYHLDAVGNVRVVTNQAGQVVERHDYLPFGEECLTPPCTPLQGTNTRKFTGKERDAETGLDYFGARYYGSKIARFTTVDPVYNWNANLVSPQRWNRYAYALNNPLRNVDPDGRDTIDLAIGFGQGIGNVAVGIVTTPIALVTNPSGVASGLAQDIRLLGHGLANPGEVADIYVQLAVSQNDADQRALGAAFGQGTAVAALVLAPTAKGAAPAQAAEASRGLGGNPFKGKTPQEIQGMFEGKGFEPRGPDPLGGKGGYVNPRTGRSYHIDPGGKYKKGVEPPHVDVNRVKGDLPKKKLEQ